MDEDSVGGPVDAAAGAESGTEQVSTTDSGGTQTGESLNPAWNPLLEKLPTSLHPIATPVLRDWDKNFQDQLQKVHSQYEPYKEFIDNQVAPQQLVEAFNLYQLLQQNPQLVYNQMQEYYGFGSEQGQQEQGGEPEGEEFDFSPDADISQHPKFQELMQNQQALAQYLVQEQEKQQQAHFEAQFDAEMETIKQQYPALDELEIYQMAVGGNISLTEAAAALNSRFEAMLKAQRTPGPRIFNGNGNVAAAQQPDPKTMNNRQTRDTIAQILAAAHDEG